MKRRGIARIVGLYVAWLIAAVMLVAAVTSPPTINFGLAPRRPSYRGHHFRSYSYGRGYYNQRRDFYTLLRWVCCAAFAYSAVTAFQMKRVAWTWIFGVLAILFNPLVRVYLQRATWQAIDWGAIGVIVIAAIVFWRDKRMALESVSKATTRGWSKNGGK
jgi:hypothetical protein